VLEKALEFVQERWGVIWGPNRVTFLVVAASTFALGAVASRVFYSQHVTTVDARLASKDDEIGRLRVALGIDPASRGALIALTNEEMKAKSISTARALRELCFSLRDKGEAVKKEIEAKNLDEKSRGEQMWAFIQKASDQFDASFRSEVGNVDNELRRRLHPGAIASIVRNNPSLYTTGGQPVSILSLFPSGTGFSSLYLCTQADAIERMAELLPLNPGER
jgi:hypothetical protein